MMAKNLFNSRKAQLTIFIIIGIMMVFGSALIFYVKSKISQKESFDEVIGTVPMEVAPIKEYVERCMYDLGKQAIILIGENGGYIEINRSTIKNVPGQPTMSDGIELMEDTNMVVPYWFHMNDDDRCQGGCSFDTSLIPELKKESLQDNDPLKIDNQISGYIEQNLEECLDGFKSFKEVGMEVTKSKKPLATTTITSKEVRIDVKYPVDIMQGNMNHSMQYFSQKFDVRLEYAYWLARQLVYEEMKNYYLEQSAANLITSFGGVDKSMPPMYGGTDFDFDAPYPQWEQNKVRQEIQNILVPYTSNFKVTNTKSMSRIKQDSGEDNWDFIINKMNYMINLEYNYLFPLDVRFMYLPDWQIYSEVTPNSGGMITPQRSDTPFLGFLGLGMTRYDFSYDLSYPVLVEIKDDNAFNKEGYSFYIAMEANLRNNQALFAPNSDNYFNSGKIRTVEPKYLCDESGKRTGDITVKAYDYSTGKPVSNAQVYSSFLNAKCQEGVTDKTGSYTGNFQSGIGRLTVKKNRYLDYGKLYVFGINKIDTQMIYLYPKQKVKVNLHEVTYTQSSGFNAYHIEKMSGEQPTKKVMIYFERVKDNISDADVRESIAYSGDFDKDTYIELYPGSYTLRYNYINEEEYTTPATENFISQTVMNISEMKMPLSVSIEANSPEYLFVVHPSQLYSSKELDVYVPIPEVYEEQYIKGFKEMTPMIDMLGVYERFYDVLQPELK